MKWILPTSFAAVLAFVVVAGEKVGFSGTIEGWNDDTMDQITFLEPGPWGGRYDVIGVEPVDLSQTKLSGKDKARAAAEEAAKLMDQWAQEAVRAGYAAGAPKLVSAAETISPEARVITLRWRCDLIDPGSRAKRFWVGFGAGHGGVTFSGSLLDKASGKELVKFTHRRLSGRGLVPTGGIYEHVLKEAGAGTANDVGQMLAIVIRTRPAN